MPTTFKDMSQTRRKNGMTLILIASKLGRVQGFHS